MIDRYETTDDVVPHETVVLVVDDDRDCFGTTYDAVIEDIRDRIGCDRHLIQERYVDPGSLPGYDELLQVQVLVVSQESVSASASDRARSLLETEPFPSETRLVLLADGDRDASDLREEYVSPHGNSVTVVDSRIALEAYLLGVFETASPCTGAGLAYLLAWNNTVADVLGIPGE